MLSSNSALCGCQVVAAEVGKGLTGTEPGITVVTRSNLLAMHAMRYISLSRGSLYPIQ